MKLALLGTDADTPALIAAAVARGDRIVTVCDVDPNLVAALQHDMPETVDHWEGLLSSTDFDAVLVSRLANEDIVAEALRKLASAGTPVLVAHPVSNSMLLYFELDMIRSESQGILLPVLTARNHPAVQRLSNLMLDGDASVLGPIEQIVIERFLNDRSRTSVLTQFARDVDVLRFLVGDMHSLSAMSSGSGDAAYSNLGVQLTALDGMLMRWSVNPVETVAGGRLSLIGARGKASLWMPGQGPWQLTEPSAAGQQMTSFPDAGVADQERTDLPVAALDALAATIGGQRPLPDWTDAGRSVELAETVERSLHKGRTIELHGEEFSEVGTFKGTMTSVGCGLLILILFLLPVLALAQKIAQQAGWIAVANVLGHWPQLLLLLTAIFLGMQFMLKMAAPAARRADNDPPHAPDGH